MAVILASLLKRSDLYGILGVKSHARSLGEFLLGVGGVQRMGEKPSDPGEPARCPICGSIAESGCIYGPDRGWTGLQWRAGEPSIWGNVVTGFAGGLPLGVIGVFRGPYVRGVRCVSCRRIVLELSGGELSGGEDGPGSELINQASDLERDGEWDRAIALYRRVLGEPEFVAHHEYARRGIEAIEEKKSAAGGGA
jgi:hypothetical protein